MSAIFNSVTHTVGSQETHSVLERFAQRLPRVGRPMDSLPVSCNDGLHVAALHEPLH